MSQSQNQFVVDLLTTLREERFSLPGWWRFLWRSWEMSCATADANPALKHSWLYTTLFISMLTVSILIVTVGTEGINVALRLLPGLVFCVAWQQSDLFWHLGLNRQAQTGELFQKVGLANFLTGLRGLCASYLIARLVSGLSTPTWLAFTIFLLGVATDILDGWVARFTGTQSKLGQIADSEADFCLYLAIAIILVQNALLPLWLGIVMILRFLLPLLTALVSYFLFAHPVRFGSTIWGKYAGLAQCLYFLLLLAPPQFGIITRIANLPLLVVTIVLLVVAPVVQVVKNVVGLEKV